MERAVPGGQDRPRHGLLGQGLPPRQLHLHRRRPQARATAAGLPGICPPDVQHPGQPGLPELLHAGAQFRHAQVPAGQPLSRAALAGAVHPRRGGRAPCCRTRPARSRAAPPSSISRSTGAGAGSSPATRSRSISVPAPAAQGPVGAEQHRPLRRPRRATTRSAAPAPSTRTCEACHDRGQHRPEACGRGGLRAVLPARRTGRGPGRRAPLARPRRHVRDAADRPGPGGAPADRGAAAAQRAAGGDHRLPRRDRPAAPRPRQPVRAGMHRPHGRHPRAAPGGAGGAGQGRGGLSRQATAANGGRAELPRSQGAGRVGAEAGLHRAQELRARLRAPADPRAARQLPGRRGEVHRPGSDGQGRQPVQDVLKRPLHHGRRPADDGGNRPRPRHREVDVGGLLARRRRRGGASALPSPVFRQDRGLGRRRRDQQRGQVPRPRLPAGVVRPQDVDLDGRPGSGRLRRGARPRGRPRRRRRHGAQPGSLRRQPVHLRRGGPRRRRPLLRATARAHRRPRRPPRATPGRSTWTCASRSTC